MPDDATTPPPSRPVSSMSDLGQDMSEKYCFDPTYAPLKVIRDTLYDSATLRNTVEDFLEEHWQGYKIDVHGTYAIGVELLHRQFRKLVEKSIETALDEAGYSLHDVRIALRRARLTNPTGDDAGITSVLAATFEFDTFVSLLREKHEEKKEAIVLEKRRRIEKYQAAGGRKLSQKHHVPEHIQHD